MRRIWLALGLVLLTWGVWRFALRADTAEVAIDAARAWLPVSAVVVVAWRVVDPLRIKGIWFAASASLILAAGAHYLNSEPDPTLVQDGLTYAMMVGGLLVIAASSHASALPRARPVRRVWCVIGRRTVVVPRGVLHDITCLVTFGDLRLDLRAAGPGTDGIDLHLWLLCSDVEVTVSDLQQPVDEAHVRFSDLELPRRPDHEATLYVRSREAMSRCRIVEGERTVQPGRAAGP